MWRGVFTSRCGLLRRHLACEEAEAARSSPLEASALQALLEDALVEFDAAQVG